MYKKQGFHEDHQPAQASEMEGGEIKSQNLFESFSLSEIHYTE
jgi:hypothetical protein